jgi:hypothetical protein
MDLRGTDTCGAAHLSVPLQWFFWEVRGGAVGVDDLGEWDDGIVEYVFGDRDNKLPEWLD